jgi:diguanylate cyclase (GGDEF)-like protein
MEGEEYARRLADTDPLTGLLNRRAFLDRAIGRPGRQVLQIADLDHFKQVNDTLGHDGGDEVLRVFARLLRNAVPTGALVARMGGEEFAILASPDEKVEAETILARLRSTRMPFDVRVTASIGTCSGPLRTEAEWKALYRGADRALFDAKSAGRDRVRAAADRKAA